MPAIHNRQRFRLRAPALGLTLLLAALALPASAQDFVSSNRTVAGGNPMNSNYSGQSVFVGSSGFANGNFVAAPDVQVDIVAPAQFNFSDSTGGFFAVRSNSWVRMSGVTGAAGGGERWGVRLEGVNLMAELRGGTVNGGVRTTAASNQTALQATLSGSLVVNGGVFATGNAAINVTGGSYTRFSGADASFFAMGTNTINFFGTDLALSAPTAGSVFETNNFSGNFYTFTRGTFSGGQSAIGLKLFDAVGSQLGGGFTLNPSPVPEPASALLLLLALPALGALVRSRGRTG